MSKEKLCNKGHRYSGAEPCKFCYPKFRTYVFKAKLWLYDGHAAWHFITVPVATSGNIKSRFSHAKRGWGSLPVIVTIGKSSWKTSIFPDTKANAYLLPIKGSVRKAEKLIAGNMVSIRIEIQE